MKNESKKHGIISIVQSQAEDNSEDITKLFPENEPEKPKEHGVISIVQSPDEAKNKEN